MNFTRDIGKTIKLKEVAGGHTFRRCQVTENEIDKKNLPSLDWLEFIRFTLGAPTSEPVIRFNVDWCNPSPSFPFICTSYGSKN